MPDGAIRYYYINIEHDLFDQIVCCRWGTVGTNRGGRKIYVPANIEELQALLKQLAARRVSRGYELLEDHCP